jgi:predicted protein tyrosine phosphatase
VKRPRRVLFVCHYNRRRSATAERLFCKRPDLDVRSAGTARDSLVQINRRMLEWADTIFTMDHGQHTALGRMFHGHPALDRLICLHIPDEFPFLDSELVRLLKASVTPHLEAEAERLHEPTAKHKEHDERSRRN